MHGRRIAGFVGANITAELLRRTCAPTADELGRLMPLRFSPITLTQSTPGLGVLAKTSNTTAKQRILTQKKGTGWKSLPQYSYVQMPYFLAL
jgi:hypothetical protein